jgi:hypothetical protein
MCAASSSSSRFNRQTAQWCWYARTTKGVVVRTRLTFDQGNGGDTQRNVWQDARLEDPLRAEQWDALPFVFEAVLQDGPPERSFVAGQAHLLLQETEGGEADRVVAGRHGLGSVIVVIRQAARQFQMGPSARSSPQRRSPGRRLKTVSLTISHPVCLIRVSTSIGILADTSANPLFSSRLQAAEPRPITWLRRESTGRKRRAS